MELIHNKHNPKLVEEPMVYQLWEDGELTLTKAGELFGCRNLHLMECGDSTKGVDWQDMPVKQNNKHGYAFVTRDDAMEIRKAMGL